MSGKVDRGESVVFTPKKEGVNLAKSPDSFDLVATSHFIKSWEGVRLRAYWDVNAWAICYGNKSYRGEVTNQTSCEKRINNRVIQIKNYVDQKFPNQNFSSDQYTSLISLYYNVLNPKHVEYRIKKGYSDESVANAIRMYNAAGGKILRGLTKRREAEAQLFLN